MLVRTFPVFVRDFAFVARCLAAVAALLFAALHLAPLQAAPLRIGVLSTVANEATEKAVALAKAEGLEVQLVEFTDWLLPNTAVSEGSLDANFFQHAPFLEQYNLNHQAKLVPVAYGYSTTIGLFSKTLAKGDAVPDGATIAIPSDPVNSARALLLLQGMGLLQLKPGVEHRAAKSDIVGNPRKLRITPIDGAQTARVFDDVTAVLTYATFAKQAGIDEQKGLAFDNTVPGNVRRYAIRWVARPDRAQDPRLQRFIAIYQQSPEVKEILRRKYGALIDFPW